MLCVGFLFVFLLIVLYIIIISVGVFSLLPLLDTLTA